MHPQLWFVLSFCRYFFFCARWGARDPGNMNISFFWSVPLWQRQVHTNANSKTSNDGEVLPWQHVTHANGRHQVHTRTSELAKVFFLMLSQEYFTSHLTWHTEHKTTLTKNGLCYSVACQQNVYSKHRKWTKRHENTYEDFCNGTHFKKSSLNRWRVETSYPKA